MFGRTMFRLLALVALVVVLVVGGGAVYQLGLTEGVARGAAQAAGTTTQVVLPYGYGGGFGFFGFLAVLFFLFLVFGLTRAILFGSRGGRHGGHGPWGRGWSHEGGAGKWAQGPWADRATEHLETWHREAHGGPSGGSDDDRSTDGGAR